MSPEMCRQATASPVLDILFEEGYCTDAFPIRLCSQDDILVSIRRTTCDIQ